eukprot:TRINITY_DN5564_c0_g1_i1.p1 TRINITY_DN5564_c0_g1~~TRINITY_DN5564_c0_g1_i1.p1  ORF type:complete len:820 (-),score=124.42 TRINITY_DN5564_c0_g1_i1:81-2540(-)
MAEAESASKSRPGCLQRCRSTLEVLVSTRTTAEMWHHDCRTLFLVVFHYGGFNLLLRGVSSALFGPEAEQHQRVGNLIMLCDGAATLVAGVVIACKRKSISASAFERIACWSMAVHLQFCALHNAVAHASAVEHLYYSLVMIFFFLPRKCWFGWLYCQVMASGLGGVGVRVVIGDPVFDDPLMMAGGGLISLFLVPTLYLIGLTQLERFQLLRQSLEEQTTMNKALLGVLCDSYLKLDMKNVVVEADQRMSEMLGVSLTGSSLSDFFASNDELERFQNALAMQVWPTPALLNVTMKNMDGAPVEVEIFIIKKSSTDVAKWTDGTSALLGLRTLREQTLSSTFVGPSLSKADVVVDAIPADLESTARHTAATVDVFKAEKDCTLQMVESLGQKEHWYLEADRVSIPQPCKQLGHGAYGSVLLAQVDGSPAALKCPWTGVSQSILTELRTVRHLRHPNIVLFLGATIRPKCQTLSIAYEYVEGQDLHRFIDGKRAHLSKIDSVEMRLMVNISGALRYMHSQRPCVLHGDLKPTNIMVVQQCGRLIAKVLDFGLAQIVSAGKGGVIGGTPRWCPPESALQGILAPASDVYAFGCIAVFLLIAKVPYSKYTPQQIMHAVKDSSTSPYDWRSVANKAEKRGASASVLTGLKPCLQYDYQQRPQVADINASINEIFMHLYDSVEKHVTLAEAEEPPGVVAESSLLALQADTGQHSDSDIVVWLRCCTGRKPSTLVCHATPGFISRVGGSSCSQGVVDASPSLADAIRKLFLSKVGGSLAIGSVRCETETAHVLIGKCISLVHAVPEKKESIMKVEFSEEAAMIAL